jgi:hypothetical protein
MLKSVEGVYTNGRVELLEPMTDIKESAVIVTFLSGQKQCFLSEFGLDETHAAEIRARLSTFEEDWNRPDMDGYDAL